MVDVNRMTVKVQEALQQAGGIAARRNHQGIDVEHLLMALLEQDGALGPALLEAAGVAPRAVRDALERELARRPQVRGAAAGPSQTFITQRLSQLLTKAEDEMKALKDEFKARGLTAASGDAYAVTATEGRGSLRRIRIAPLGRAGRRSIAIPCDLLAVSGGWNPILHLYAQAQGRLHYDEALTAFVPGAADAAVECVERSVPISSTQASSSCGARLTIAPSTPERATR